MLPARRPGASLSLRFQFDVPVSVFDERLPGSVLVVAELHAQQRTGFRLGRLADQLDAGLFGSSVALSGVAPYAGQYAIFPVR